MPISALDPFPALARPAVAAVVVAAGQGTRLGVAEKCLLPLAGRPMLAHVLAALEGASLVGSVVVVVGAHTRDAAVALVADGAFPKVAAVVAGGERRQDSVAAGLAAVPAGAEVVVVHDGARPLAGADLFDRCAAAALASGAAIAALPVADTLKRVRDGRIAETVDRAGLWAAQTPQAFRRDVLARLRPELTGARTVTDEAALCEALGIPVAVVPGSPANLKITRPDDLPVAEALHRGRGLRSDHRVGATPGSPAPPPPAPPPAPPAPTGQTETPATAPSSPPRRLAASPPFPRVGIGYDAHRFAPGRRLRLGGVDLAHDRGLAGHSDADVLLHAVADAFLGAAALGDIGRHFPPSDPRYQDADSRMLLREVHRLLAEAGWRPLNVDATLLAEAPQIAPHVPAMRAEIAACLGLPPAAVGVKATTNEGMGFVGRGEGIAALATATIAPLDR